MRVIIHDTVVTAPFILPVLSNWVELPVEIEPRTTIQGREIGPDQIALIPSAEVAWLQETHQVIPDVAVVATNDGTIAMRVPVRPDEVEGSLIRLYHASGTAELLSRATMHPFYGIIATEWTSDDNADAQVVIVEGAMALQPPEAGFSEDLIRAWFIMTGQPVVTHLLVAPKGLDRAALAPVLNAFNILKASSHEHRRDLRKLIAERNEVDRERVTTLLAAQRFALEPDDRRALLMLLQRGNRGSTFPYVWELTYLEPDATDDCAATPE